MEIKLKNGKAIIKDKYTRKIRKKYNSALSENIKMKADQTGQTDFEGFSMEAIDKGNDILLFNMVEELELGGEKKEIKQEVFDEMDNSDVDLILAEIDKLATGNQEVKKK